MKQCLSVLGGLVLLASSGLAHGQTMPPLGASRGGTLQPVQNWVLDYGESQCSAMRAYSDAAHPITLAIVPSPNGETYELMVLRERQGIQYANELEGSVDFGQGPIKSWLLEYTTKAGKFAIYQFRISAAQMAQARSAPGVTFSMQGAKDVRFELDTIPKLLDAMEKCTADLKDYWNMDGEKNGRIAVSSKGDLRHVFSSNDYPSQAMQRGQEGSARYLLLVDEKGSVAGCHVLSPSGVPILDAMGCSVIKGRSRLNPARDAAGKPVRSTVVTPPINWQIDN